MRRLDVTGEKFGKLTALKCIGVDEFHSCLWKCRCECGNYTTVRLARLTSGHTKSCGCLNTRQGNVIHGKYRSRLYRIWDGMKQRCYNPNHKHYRHYGGRNIKVCDEWRYDFKSFYDWAMKNGYEERLTIDRIDNDKGYAPDNCRWATMKEQNLNKRNSKKRPAAVAEQRSNATHNNESARA